eukprot:839451-Karenia_brevis.AAC.1
MSEQMATAMYVVAHTLHGGSRSRDHQFPTLGLDSMPTHCSGKPSHWHPKPGLRLFTKSTPPANYMPMQPCIFNRSKPGQKAEAKGRTCTWCSDTQLKAATMDRVGRSNLDRSLQEFAKVPAVLQASYTYL